MPLQNRVTPFGEIVADPARGLFMGNRGGQIHDPKTRTLRKRRWASRQWIICEPEFKGRQRQVMGNSYTELFFLDEVTALAAGHRPCFECRRQAANAFFAAHTAFSNSVPTLPGSPERLKAPQMDMILHIERTQMEVDDLAFDLDECADGSMFEHDGEAWALRGKRLLRWTPAGYDRSVSYKKFGDLKPLTPMSTMCCLQFGYQPVWHPSADQV